LRSPRTAQVQRLSFAAASARGRTMSVDAVVDRCED